MRAGSTVRIVGMDNTVSDTQEIYDFYNKLDQMSGKNVNGDIVDKAQVTGKIRLRTIAYSDFVTLSEMYPEVNIIAEQIICVVNFWNEGVLHMTQKIVQGKNAKTPEVPEKQSTQKNYYTFNSWDTDYTNVQTDLNINARFDEHIQVYRVTFDSQSNLISVTPAYADIEYGSKVDAPTFGEIPAQVEFHG